MKFENIVKIHNKQTCAETFVGVNLENKLIVVKYNDIKSHHQTSIKFDDIESLTYIYYDLKDNIDNGFMWLEKSYIIYPHVFDYREENSNKIIELSHKEMIDYIKSGKTYLKTELENDVYFLNLDVLNMEYTSSPKFARLYKISSITSTDYYECETILMNNCYLVPEQFASSDDDIHRLIIKNINQIKDRINEFNYNYLYSINLKIIPLTQKCTTVNISVRGASVNN